MFTERTADKVVDRLFAKALALDDGTTRVVWCVVDSCMMPRELIDAAKAEASKTTGLPSSHMLVSATHTHSAPSAMGCLGSRVDPDYAAWLPGKIAEAMVGAVQRLRPARVGWTVVDDWDHTFNRRWIRRPDRLLEDPFGQRNVRANMHPGHESPDAVGPSGPVDPGLSLLALETPEGKPLALFANYSQHYYGSELLSSDYFGRFAGHLAKKLGADAGFVAAMSQGTSGDLASMDYSAPARRIGYEAYAEEIASRAEAAYRHIAWHTAAPLKIAERALTLNYRLPDTARLAWAKETAARLGDRLPQTQPEIYALEAAYLHEKQETELKLQALRVGDLGVTAIPNEVYAITGLKLKAQSPLVPTFNVSLANGSEGYIPPPEQHKLGGYTTWPARTAGLEPGAEPRIVETVLGMLEEVAGKPRRALAASHGPYARAVLADRPLAYWRLDEMVIPTAHDGTGHGRDAVMEDGLALYLPGVGSGRAISPDAALKPSAFSGAEINRSVHFAGGRLRTTVPLGSTFTAEIWLWNGLSADARPVTGYFFSRGPDGDPAARGEHLGLGGTFRGDLAGKLILFNGNDRQDLVAGRTKLAMRAWHHVVFVRDGKRVRVHLDGAADPEIAGELEATVPPGENSIFLGGRTDRLFGWEGRLDEVAVYSRALTPGEITAHYQASGLTPPVKPVVAAAGAASVGLSPAESMKKIHVRAGYHLELAAAEPLTMDPVAIDWDAAGRLWVVEMADYPLGMDGKGSPGGRVRVLDDRDGDGRYDTATLFAEGLQMPTGLLTWRGGVLVTTAPEILFLKDSNGDGRADVREVLYSGFQVGNPQLRVNGLRWGLDNWVYCAAGGHHGSYGVNTRIRSHRTGNDVLVGSRDTRLRPDTGEIEPESGPSQFGRNRDDWGRWFGTQNSFPLWNYVLPDHYLRRNPHVAAPDPVVQVMTPQNPKVFPAITPDKRYHSFDQAGHFTSACSGMIYGDDLLFPRSQETHGFACEPFHNLVHHELVSDEGVSFRARRAPEEQTSEFFASEDRWVRPVMTRTGPDGALWVVDMYRAMIEHPEWLPPEGRAELLPHYREGDEQGRIYRLVPDGAPARKPPRLETLSIPGLVAALDSPNVWQRDKVQQLLVSRQNAAAVPALERLARESRNPFARLHALCTLDGLNALVPAQVETALNDPHPGVRENALRLAETRGTPGVIAAACRLNSDPDAKVRLQLAFTLGEWKDRAAGEALGKLAIANATDRHVVAAVMSSGVPHAGALVEAVAESTNESLAGLIEPLLKLSLALDHRDALARLVRRLLTRQGGDFSARQMEEFSRFLDLLTQRKLSVNELAKGDDELSRELRRASELFKSAGYLAGATDRDTLERITATGLLVRHRDSQGEPSVMGRLEFWLADPHSSLDVQRAALRALAAGPPWAIPRIVERCDTLGPEMRTAVIDELLSREASTGDLLIGLENGRIAASALDASRRSRLLKHSSAAVRERAARVFTGGPATNRAKVIEQFRPALQLKANPANGRSVFLLRCASCHRRDDVGNDIGPDLKSVTAHEPERLLSAILDPSADVQPGFQAYKCRLSGGEELYGIITAETATSLVLKLADASTRTILRSDIAALECLNTSLMPEGLEAGLSAQEMADLIALLRAH